MKTDNDELMENLRRETRAYKKRDYKIILRGALKISHETLFDIWADFDDYDSPKEVKRFCSDLGYVDAISFMAFCYGYEKAVQAIKERL